VWFGVTDAGAGFPEAFLPHAFERLRRADEAREGAGSGLGLAIVAAVAGAHRGQAYATNTGAGARVGFSLPVVSRTVPEPR
jgi:two-component system, OmpR family, sensor kinase